MSTEENVVKLNSLNYSLKVDDKNMKKEMLKPFLYFTSTPTTKFRKSFLQVLRQWMPVPDDKFAKIDALAHHFFNGIFLIDDVQDQSILRRGIPCAHNVYGIPRVLMTFDWILSMTYGFLDELNDKEVAQMFVKNIAASFAGQGMEIYWRENNICPTEEQYLQMVYRKTSLQFLLFTRTMNACSMGKEVDAEKLITVLGLYFQLCDDYNNLSNQNYFDNKGFCDDLSEGKFSFPIVHTVHNFPEEGNIVKDILAQRTQDVNEKKYCISILEKCGSFEYTRNKLKELKGTIYEEAAKLDPNPVFKEFLEKCLPNVVNYH